MQYLKDVAAGKNPTPPAPDAAPAPAPGSPMGSVGPNQPGVAPGAPAFNNMQGATPQQLAAIRADLLKGGGSVGCPSRNSGYGWSRRQSQPRSIGWGRDHGSRPRRVRHQERSGGLDDAAGSAMNDMARNKEIRNLVTNFKPGALTPLCAVKSARLRLPQVCLRALLPASLAAQSRRSKRWASSL